MLQNISGRDFRSYRSLLSCHIFSSCIQGRNSASIFSHSAHVDDETAFLNLSFYLSIVFCLQSPRQQRLGLFEASVSENPLENAIWLIFKPCWARQHANKSPRIPFGLVQIDNCKADYPTRQRKIMFGHA